MQNPKILRQAHVLYLQPPLTTRHEKFPNTKQVFSFVGSTSVIKMNQLTATHASQTSRSLENNVEELTLDLARHDFMKTMLTSEPATFNNSQ